MLMAFVAAVCVHHAAVLLTEHLGFGEVVVPLALERERDTIAEFLRAHSIMFSKCVYVVDAYIYDQATQTPCFF
jgi:hypothetical protein